MTSKTDISNARAWGQLYALMQRWLPKHSDRWDGLTAPEIDGMCLKPAATIGRVLSRATACHALTPEVDAEVQRLMSDIDVYDGMLGTADHPLTDDEAGAAFWFACYRYIGPQASLLTPAQVAERLGVTPERVRMMIGDGTIAAVKGGGRWVISSDEADRIEAERTRA